MEGSLDPSLTRNVGPLLRGRKEKRVSQKDEKKKEGKAIKKVLCKDKFSRPCTQVQGRGSHHHSPPPSPTPTHTTHTTFPTPPNPTPLPSWMLGSLLLVLGEPLCRDGGIPQGCPLRKVFIVALYVPWFRHLGSLPDIEPQLYADNLKRCAEASWCPF